MITDQDRGVITTKDLKRILAGLVISLIAIGIIIYLADFKQVLTALRMADFSLVFIVVLLTLAWLVVRGLMWRTLLCEEATYYQVFMTINEGYLINNILPLRLGELARSWLLSRKAGLAFWRVFSTIVLERALDIMMAVGLLLVSISFVVSISWAVQAAVGTGIIVVMGLLMLYLMARYSNWVMATFERLTYRWTNLSNRGKKYLGTFLDGLTVLTDGKRFLRAVVWLILGWGIGILQYYVLLRAFFTDPEIYWAIFTIGVSALGAATPSSPGAIGVYEASVVGALAVFGLNASISLALAITAHAINFLVTGLIGTFALVQDGIQITRVGDLYKQLRGITPGNNP